MRSERLSRDENRGDQCGDYGGDDRASCHLRNWPTHFRIGLPSYDVARIVTRSSPLMDLPKGNLGCTKGTGYPMPGTCTSGYVVKKSTIAFFMTSRPTSLIDFVSGISFGQTSTQFCA